MAIQWGSQSGRYQIGVDLVRTSQTASTETWRASVHLRSSYGVSDSSNRLTVSGSFAFTGSINASLPVNGGTQQIWSSSKTFSRPLGSNSQGRVSATLVDVYPGGAPTVARAFTVAGQPTEAPGLPTGVSAVYSPTNRVMLSFTANAGAFSPVDGFDIREQRWPAGGTTLVGQPGAARTSWGTGQLDPGSEYRYLIRQRGPAGSGDWAYTGWVKTTPLAPANVEAGRNGSNIEITWVSRSEYQSHTYEIREGNTVIASNVTGESYTVINPSTTVTHTYTVYETAGSLRSPGVSAPPVLLIAPPLAPRNLSPNGGVAARGAIVPLSWDHSPVDGSQQSQARIRYRRDGGSWLTTTITNSAQSYSAPQSWYGSATDLLEWQVQTRGGHASFGPYSPIATVSFETRPSVGFVSPAYGSQVPTDSVTVTFDVTGPAQEHAWTATVTGATPSTYSGYGRAPFTFTATGLQNGTSPRIAITAFSSVPSLETTRIVHVSYAQPPAPYIEAEWGEATGAVLIMARSNPGTISTGWLHLERRVNGGQWERIASYTAPSITTTDQTPPLNGAVEYRALAVAHTGPVAPSEPVAVTGYPPSGFWLNFGTGFTKYVQVFRNPSESTTTGRANTRLELFAGHDTPTLLVGPGRQRVVQLAGTVFDEPGSPAASTIDRLEQLADTDALVMLRTTDRPPTIGAIDSVKYTHQIWGGYQVSLTHTRAT